MHQGLRRRQIKANTNALELSFFLNFVSSTNFRAPVLVVKQIYLPILPWFQHIFLLFLDIASCVLREINLFIPLYKSIVEFFIERYTLK